MEYLKIIYREKQYSIEEIISESNGLLKELELPKVFVKYFDITEFGLVQDEGYAIAGEKFNDLFEILTSGRYALYNAHLKIIGDQNIWKNGYKYNLFLRSEHLKNAILWYNSCADYILQIIWFAFDFYSNINDYEREMFKCNYDAINTKLNLFKNKTNASLLQSKIKTFYNNNKIKKLRDLSRRLKHKQGLDFIGLNRSRISEIRTQNISSSILNKKQIDIDTTINEIAEVHKLIVEFGIFIDDFINFDSMFIKDKIGDIILQRKNKKDFKKIIINEGYST